VAILFGNDCGLVYSVCLHVLAWCPLDVGLGVHWGPGRLLGNYTYLDNDQYPQVSKKRLRIVP
jgi:hypothetical protein